MTIEQEKVCEMLWDSCDSVGNREWIKLTGTSLPMFRAWHSLAPETRTALMAAFAQAGLPARAAPMAPHCPRCGSEVFNVVMSTSYCQRADCQHEGPTAEFFSSVPPTSSQELAGRIARTVRVFFADDTGEELRLEHVIEQELKRS